MSTSKYSDPTAFDDDEESSNKPRLKRDKDGILRPVGVAFEFDCPECSANNPWDDGFKDGSEIQCHYCGQELRVQALDEKRFKYRPI